MTIQKEKQDNKLRIKLEGRLDTTTAPELEGVLSAEIDGIRSLNIDFSGLDYLSSAGLRVILGAQKAMNAVDGQMIVQNVNDTIMEIFEITGFIDILTIE